MLYGESRTYMRLSDAIEESIKTMFRQEGPEVEKHGQSHDTECHHKEYK